MASTTPHVRLVSRLRRITTLCPASHYAASVNNLPIYTDNVNFAVASEQARFATADLCGDGRRCWYLRMSRPQCRRTCQQYDQQCLYSRPRYATIDALLGRNIGMAVFVLSVIYLTVSTASKLSTGKLHCSLWAKNMSFATNIGQDTKTGSILCNALMRSNDKRVSSIWWRHLANVNKALWWR